MKRGVLHVAVLLALVAMICRAPSHAASPTPTTRASEKILRDAIRKLTQEIERARDETKLRPQSNFFTPENARQLTAAAVVDALEDAIASDHRCECYVKWQLLSAAPEGFEPALLPRVIAIYREAPDFVPRPGISEEHRRQLDVLAAKAARDEAYDLTKALEAEVARNVEANRFMLAYRDELYRLVPKTFDAINAGFEDLFERFQAGLETKVQLERLIADADAWATGGDAKPPQLAALAESLDRMLLEDGPSYYSEASFDDGKVKWKTKRPSLRQSRKLKNLIKLLRDTAADPPGELKFKDE